MKAKTKCFKHLLMLMIMAIMQLGSTLTVFAATAGSDTTIQGYIANNGDNLAGSVAGSFKQYTDQNTMNNECGAEWRYYTFTDANGVTTYFAIEASKELNVAGTISKVNQSSNMTSNLNTDVIGGFAVPADTSSANKLLSGFVAPISTLLGILVVIVTIGMTIFTALDLSYIAFPVFREKCDDKKATGGMGTKTGKDGNTKLTFITDDAQHAVIAADTVQSGKSPFIIYLKTRALSYILLSIVIFILLTGNISIFATLALKLVQGVLDFLQGFQ